MNACEVHSKCIVVYDTKVCPLCDLQEQYEALEEKVESKESHEDDLNQTIDDLREELTEALNSSH